LQAASHGVPILSLNVDPDGFVSRGGCGLVAQEDMERLAAELRRLWSDRAAAEAFGAAGRRYVAATHGLEGRIDELTALLQAAVAPRRLRLRPLRILGEAPPAAVETPQREDVAA
jgi:glycosyltransferase involved in cell wall biosynthesis